MASEIRANKQTNRVGLGTVTYTDTGIIVSGIVTANSFKGDGSSLTGIDATALKDNAGNVKIQANTSGAIHSGVSTFGSSGQAVIDDVGNFTTSGEIKVSNTQPGIVLEDTNANPDFIIQNRGGSFAIRDITNAANRFLVNMANGDVTVTGDMTATSFIGDGSSLSNLPAGAPVGGASTNTVFFENDTAVAVNYQVTSGKNAMSAGPIAINAGIAVTVPSGSSWTIV